MARPTLYNEEMQTKAETYLVEFSKEEYGKLIPSIEGLALYLGVARQTLYDWGVANATFLDTLDVVKIKQKMILLDNGLDGTFNSNIAKLALANHGMSDRTDITTKGESIKNDWHIHPTTTKDASD